MALGPVMMGIATLQLSAEERKLLQHPLIGGVILFSRNYESPEQVTALIAEIHALRTPKLLVTVDHEGGRVQRFRAGFTELPAVAQLGKAYDHNPKAARELAELSGWLMAVEMRAIGIDFSFAPVLDLGRGICEVIGDRAFHHNPEIVADLAHQYMIGMHRAGMAATGKHYPGHGGVVEDSHLALPIDRRRYEDLQMEDLVPFERMAHFGMEAVMVAHVIYEQVDPNLAGFSPFWLQEVLRKRLKFQGVIFSDDLEMEGASVVGDIADRAEAAINAGCDMVLVCKQFDAVVSVLERLKNWHNPTSQLRLSRLHGKRAITREALLADPQWQAAVEKVVAYDEPHTLGLL